MATLQEHESFPKLKRFREIIVTEKVDGTNAQVIVDADGVVRAGSRTRLITPEKDNFGFARWVAENADELRSHLGIGRHFGEWYGAGIQRRYGLEVKRLALFNAHRWGFLADAGYWNARRVDGKPAALEGVLGVVPVLYRGTFDTVAIDFALNGLQVGGSVIAPGFMDPEGVVVFDPETASSWKKTLGGDGHKGTKPEGEE